MAELSLGTSSWYFSSWSGVFYPESLPRDRYLEYYARTFRTVEVNTTFYALPSPSTLIRWVETVPVGFTFALKFPRTISHEKRLTACRRETLAFLDVLRALGDSAGPAFLQLPPKLTRAQYGRSLATYLDWLALKSEGLRIAVEARAPDLVTSAFARFLGERNMVLATVDRVNSPNSLDLSGEDGAYTDFVFVRWIGDDKNGPKGDRELSAPDDANLDLWAQRVAAWLEAGKTVFGYMHNPYEGHSPASVRRLAQRLAERVSMPQWPPPDLPSLDTIQMSLL